MKAMEPKARRRISLNLNCQRPQNGQISLVEGSVAIVLLIGVTIGLMFLILGVGITMLYKEKIAFIAAQTANYYIARNYGWNYEISTVPPDINAYCQNMASSMGLDRTKITAKVTSANMAAATSSVGITINAIKLPLLGGANLPDNISISESYAVYDNPGPRPTGVLRLTSSSGMVFCSVPCYVSPGAWGPPIVPGCDTFNLSVNSADIANGAGTRGVHP